MRVRRRSVRHSGGVGDPRRTMRDAVGMKGTAMQWQLFITPRRARQTPPAPPSQGGHVALVRKKTLVYSAIAWPRVGPAWRARARMIGPVSFHERGSRNEETPTRLDIAPGSFQLSRPPSLTLALPRGERQEPGAVRRRANGRRRPRRSFRARRKDLRSYHSRRLPAAL